MTAPALQIEDVIADVTGVRGDVERVYFAADIGNAFVDEVDWIFIKGGERRKVTLPRAIFSYERERARGSEGGKLVNFWLVEMARPFAGVYGVEEFVLTGEELAEAKLRIEK